MIGPDGKLRFRLHPKQEQFVRATDWQVVIGGGANSGKTYAAIAKLFDRARHPGAFEGVARAAATSFSASFLTDWQEMIPDSLWTMHKEDRMIHIKGGGTIHWFGCDDEQKLGSKNLSGCWFEELAEFPKAWPWNKVGTLVRKDVPGVVPQMYATTNPSEDARHWAIDHFKILDNPCGQVRTPDSLYIHTDCRDIGRDEAYIRRRFPSAMSSAQRQRLLYGRWGIGAEGLVYDNFGDHNLSRDKIDGKRVIVGVDEGCTVDSPFVAIRCEVDASDCLWVTEEIYKPNLKNPLRKVELVKRIARGAEKVIVDSAAPQLISVFRQHGIPAIKSRKAGRSISAGIDLLRLRIEPTIENVVRFRINRACMATIREFQTWAYDERTGQPIDRNNHAMDALRYVVIDLDAGQARAFGWGIDEDDDAREEGGEAVAASKPQERSFEEIINDPIWGASSNRLLVGLN